MDGYWLDLGLIDYTAAFAVQEKALAARMSGTLPPTIILQENPLTFTIGKSGNQSNVLASPETLKKLGIQVIEVSRGGDVTYHGPGQLIASPLLYLGDLGINANQYMHRMEDTLVRVLAEFGLHAKTRQDHPGVWLGGAKIGAVGIAVRHGYTFHGVSLNVNLDLAPFELINPCGVKDMPVTSMHVELGGQIPMKQVRRMLRQTIEEIFDLQLKELTVNEFTRRLDIKPVSSEGVNHGL